MIKQWGHCLEIRQKPHEKANLFEVNLDNESIIDILPS